MKIRVVDLFAGAGGMDEGLLAAVRLLGLELEDHVVINHWDRAIQTQRRNHPSARALHTGIEAVDPRVVVPGGHLHLLIAAPECTHHSTARGGRPMNDQSRSSAWLVLRWLELLKVDNLLLENVPEFEQYGPLNARNRPIKSRRGESFQALIRAIESMNYRVEYRKLNAADYGEATTRVRLFIMAVRGRRRIAWPEPTHSRTGSASLLRRTKQWRPARDIIDWSLESKSIFARKKPLAPATMRRIVEGLKRFGGPELQPFILHLTHGGRTHDVDAPLPTVTTANRGELGLAEPFMVAYHAERHGEAPRVHSTSAPIPALSTENRFGLVEPFLVPFYGERDGQEPRTHSVHQPMPVIPASGDGKFGLVQPFVLRLRGGEQSHIERSASSVDEPIRTVTANGMQHALVEPFLLGQQSGSVPRPVSEPTPTVAADGAIALVEPYLASYYGTGTATPVSQPVPTVTTKDRFGLVQPLVIDGKTLDIRFRMLQPHELAAAMGFPKGYDFAGNKGDAVKQVGNAVSVRTAAALCEAILERYADRKPSDWREEATA